jgi:hypothetical protein
MLETLSETQWWIYAAAPNKYNGIWDPVHKKAMAISDINLRKVI